MIIYLKGDATNPIGDGPRAIIHICNNSGGWGAGFVLALSKKWSQPEAQYRKWHRYRSDLEFGPFALGNIAWVQVEPNLWVVNMIAQEGYGSRGTFRHKPEGDLSIPLRYEALRNCLAKVALEAKHLGVTIHGPRLGSGLAGGSWPMIESFINESLSAFSVHIYDLV